MMKKFIFANAALLALSISGAWADAVQTIDYLGVRYTLGTPTTTTGTPSPTGTINYSTSSATSGYLTISGTETTTRTDEINYVVTPTTIIGANVTFGSWSTTDLPVTTETNTGNVSHEYLAGSDEFNSAIQEFENQGLTLYTWSETQDEIAYITSNYDEKGFLYSYEGKYYDPNTPRPFAKFKTELPNYADVLYYKVITDEGEEENGYKWMYVTYCAITKVTDSSNEVETVTNVHNYNYTSVPTDLLVDVQPTSVTIKTDITEIKDAAFHYCTKINDFNIEDPIHWYFEFNSPILYKWNNDDQREVLYVTPNVTSTDVTLTADVAKVCDYATINITKGVYIYYNNPKMKVDTEKQSVFFTWVSIEGDLEMDYNAETKSYSVMAGAPLNQKSVKKAIDNCLDSENEVCYIDFRNGLVKQDLTKVFETNYGNRTFLFGASTYKVGGTNVIYNSNNGFVCDSLILDDAASDKAFIAPVQFTAAKVKYNRQFTEGLYSTVCLPFGFNTIPAGFTIGHMVGYEQSTNTFLFDEVKSSISAYKPYIIRSDNGDQTLPVLTDIGIDKTTTITNESFNDGSFIGTLSPVRLTGGTNDYMYYGFSNKTGKLVHVGNGKSTTVKSFRCYFQAPVDFYNNSGAGEIRVQYENGEASAISSIEYIQNEDNVIYNLNGQRVNNMNAEGIYVKNGKTIIVKK